MDSLGIRFLYEQFSLAPSCLKSQARAQSLSAVSRAQLKKALLDVFNSSTRRLTLYDCHFRVNLKTQSLLHPAIWHEHCFA
jgi:hypothetical protein